MSSNKITIINPKPKLPNSNRLSSKIITKDLPEITVLEPFSPEIITFDSIDEFKEYLAENEKSMNELSTIKLNKQYKIEGYKITKLKGVISLKKIKYIEQDNELDYRVSEIEDALLTLSNKVDTIVSLLNPKS